MNVKAIQSILLLISLLLLTSCSSTSEETEYVKVEQVEDVRDIHKSLWLVDWAYEKSIEETSESIEHIDNILLFTTYFTESGEFHQTEESINLIDQVLQEKDFKEKDIYLTIINDQFMNDGTVVHKNPELLKNLLSTETSRREHIEKILTYVKGYSIDGIEIDYEKIPLDLTDEFLLFAKDLDKALEEASLSLRILLEPSFPVDHYPLPESLNYVVMAYNLYGPHSGPGPKANYEFLDNLVEKFPNYSGNIGIALSTGGFSWQEGTVKSLTNQQIQDLIDQYNPQQSRDEKSGVMFFEYIESGENVEVWYADSTTLTLWSEYLLENGEYTDFTFWRSGGLTGETLTTFEKLSNMEN
ncbi:glycosyl hydrolase family 18 protein [Metabacillus halosaccharovorans]|uniref:Glycosyl hydrolase family 18 protein n=1 Tax=Metabacillus halosaccharovorans TaxID=930124 RepID=A0ABT3DBS2_9BACI|nr:glycosyl hydrolase family 18 protein [Metabacillus halosaccharovorans]MCV9884509.1 glycosyl hydrolase family 18 protein [Metabacillus halosaccharovorans]